MNNIASAAEFVNNLGIAGFAAWIATILFVITGFPHIKKLILSVLIKLYEFFIQKNTVRL